MGKFIICAGDIKLGDTKGRASLWRTISCKKRLGHRRGLLEIFFVQGKGARREEAMSGSICVNKG